MKPRIITLTVCCALGLVLAGMQCLHASTRVSAASAQGWGTVSDEYYGYSFELPVGWHRENGVTPDRLASWGDPVSLERASQIASAHGGLMKVEFAADPVGHWLPDPEVRDPLVDARGSGTRDDLIPLLPKGTWRKVGGMPALVFSKMPIDSGDGSFVEATCVYILAERMVYHLWIGYAPPSSADETARAQFVDAADRVTAHILSSFAIAPDR